MKELKIGNVTLDNPLVLAPMAGVTDLPFRLLCKEQGVGLICMEMISAKAVLYNNKNTEQLLKIDERECPVSMQLFGSEPEIVSGIAARLEERPFAFLDINMGCPAPKLVKNGDGAGLLLDLKNVESIVKEAVKVSTKPITVKTRKGFNEERITAVDVAKICNDNGVAFVTIHGRTREQYYAGQADLDIIRKVKESVKIPVIGNGDIINCETAKRMFEYTGCDGIMVARGAQGNPWVFKSILEENDYIPSLEELFNVIYKHIEYQLEIDDKKQSNLKLRKHIAWYLKGLNGSSKIRDEVNKSEDIESTKKILKNYYDKLKEI